MARIGEAATSFANAYQLSCPNIRLDESVGRFASSGPISTWVNQAPSRAPMFCNIALPGRQRPPSKTREDQFVIR